jgi:hypothetical protein
VLLGVTFFFTLDALASEYAILDETAAYFGGRGRAVAVFGIRVWTAIRHRH